MAATHIAVRVPSGDMVHTDFMMSLLHLVQNARGAGFRISMVNTKFSTLTESRNLCVGAAQEAKVDAMLFLDSDMIFPPDTVARLWAHRLSVVGATYPRRIFPLQFIGRRVDGAAFRLADRGLVEAGRLPTGCLLLKMEIFDQLKRPYFRCGFDEGSGQVLGEDLWFSDRPRELGMRLWYDMDLSRQVEHIGNFRYVLRENSE